MISVMVVIARKVFHFTMDVQTTGLGFGIAQKIHKRKPSMLYEQENLDAPTPARSVFSTTTRM